MLYPKARIVRSERYRRWVASLPCIACGVEGFSQAAHSNQSAHGKGMSMKACDLSTFPLCAPHWGLIGCHQQHDLCIDMTRDERSEREARYIAETQARAREAGQLKEAA